MVTPDEPVDLAAVAADDAGLEALRASLDGGPAAPGGDVALGLLAALAADVGQDLPDATSAHRLGMARRRAGRTLAAAAGLAVLFAGGVAAAAAPAGSPLRPVRDVVTVAVQHAVAAVRPHSSPTASPGPRPGAPTSPALPPPSGATSSPGRPSSVPSVSSPPSPGASPSAEGEPEASPSPPPGPVVSPGRSPDASPGTSEDATPEAPASAAPTATALPSRVAARRAARALDRAEEALDEERAPAALTALHAAGLLVPDVTPSDGRARLQARLHGLQARYDALPPPAVPVSPGAVPTPTPSAVPVVPVPVLPSPVLPSPVLPRPVPSPVLPSPVLSLSVPGTLPAVPVPPVPADGPEPGERHGHEQGRAGRRG